MVFHLAKEYFEQLLENAFSVRAMNDTFYRAVQSIAISLFYQECKTYLEK